jgi:ankyrin repeat protein
MCDALLQACTKNIKEWKSEDEASKDALDILNDNENKIDLNTCVSRDEYGWTPLSYAIRSGLKKVVKKLIEKGADINHQDKRGVTPFMRALVWKQCDIALFLKEKGADLTKKDNEDKTTDAYAKESDCTSLKKTSLFGGRRKTKSTRRRRSKTKATRKR